MSAPEAPDPASDTLIIEPVPPLAGTGSGTGGQGPKPDTLSVITTDPKTGVTTETTLESSQSNGQPHQVVLEIRKRFTELDGLRGTAALIVVFFHLRKYIVDLNPPKHLDMLLAGGDLMVDLFFVLSGFVLARSMLATKTAKDVVRFSTMRVRRFMPLHLAGVGIAFACVLLTLILQQVDFSNAPHRPAFTTEQETFRGWLSAVLLVQGFLGPHFAGYAAAWSLSIELWTNILLVVAIALIPWGRRKQWVGPVAMVIGAIILFTAPESGENSMGWTAFGRGLTGLGTGMVVYWVYTATMSRGIGAVTGSGTVAPAGATQVTTAPTRPMRWASIGGLIGLLAIPVVMYFSRDLHFLHFTPIMVVGAFLIFFLAHPVNGPAHRFLNSRIAQWLGSRSFALYALHASVLTAVQLAARLTGVNMHAPAVATAIIVTTLVASLLAAEFGHRFIERLLVPKKSG